MFVYATSYLTERMHVSVTKVMDINTLNLFFPQFPCNATGKFDRHHLEELAILKLLKEG